MTDTSQIKDICPIKGVSKDCNDCPMGGWEDCVHVKIWQERKKGKPTKTVPYIPLTETTEHHIHSYRKGWIK